MGEPRCARKTKARVGRYIGFEEHFVFMGWTTSTRVGYALTVRFPENLRRAAATIDAGPRHYPRVGKADDDSPQDVTSPYLKVAGRRYTCSTRSFPSGRAIISQALPGGSIHITTWRELSGNNITCTVYSSTW